MSECPAPGLLEQLASGSLSASERAGVDAHVAVCRACRDRLSILRDNLTQYSSKGKPPADAAPGSEAEGNVIPALRDHPRYADPVLIGSGGMGTVYRARHRLLDRAVVLKVIRQDLVDNPEMVERFRREARLAARLDHPNIVAIYEAEQVGDLHVLVMEAVDGLDLAALVRHHGPLSIPDACALIAQAARGLQHAFERGMVHRDIKPSNLMLARDGRLKLLDLGLAKLRCEGTDPGQADGLTGDHRMLGSIDFASPEQWEESARVDIKADIYSLGCTLYYLLTGSVPFPRSRYSTILKQMWAHAHEPYPSIRAARPDAPDALVDVLDAMLAKDPARRYDRPIEVAEALQPLAEGADLASLVTEGGRPVGAAGGNAPDLADTVEHHWLKPGESGGSSPTAPDLDRIRPGGRRSDSTASIRRRRRRLTRRLGAAAALMVIGVVSSLVAAWLIEHRGASSAGAVRQPDPKAPPAFVGEPIKVGVLHSRTGTMALSERPVIDATLLAIEEINAAGGVLGRKLEPVFRDGQSNPEVFAEAADDLISDDHVAVLFGCWTSSSRKAVKEVVERHGHLLFYPLQYEGIEQSPNIVYLGLSPNQQLIPAVRWCLAFLDRRKVYLVGSDYVYPRAAAAILRDEIRALGCEVVGEEFVPLGRPDFDPIAARIAASGADLLINLVNGDSNVALFRDLREAGVTSAAIPTLSTSLTEEELGSLSPADAAGDYLAWSYFMSIDRAENRSFIRRFQDRYGPQRLATDPMQTAYVGVQLWAKAVAAAGTTEMAAVRSAIRGQSYEAPEGPIAIDPDTLHAVRIARVARINPQGKARVVYSSVEPVEPEPFPASRTREQWETFLLELQRGWGGAWASPSR